MEATTAPFVRRATRPVSKPTDAVLFSRPSSTVVDSQYAPGNVGTAPPDGSPDDDDA